MEREKKEQKDSKNVMSGAELEGSQGSGSRVVVQKTLEMKEEDVGKF